MNNIGISFVLFEGLRLHDAMRLSLELLYKFSLSSVEIRFEKEEKIPSLWPWDKCNELSDFLNNFRIKGSHLPFIDINPVSSNPLIKEKSLNILKRGIERSSRLEMDYAVMHARGGTSFLADPSKVNDWFVVLSELEKCAEDNSIVLSVENADYFSELSSLVFVIRRINSKNLKMTFDTGHAFNRLIPSLQTYPIKELFFKIMDITFLPFIFKTNMPYEKYGSISNFITSERDIIYNVHLHDNNGKIDHLSLGKGNIDFSFLKNFNENVNFIFEFISKNNHFSRFEENYKQLQRLMEF